MSKIKLFALGGLNENGKNMYVADIDDKVFILDAGMKYADDKMLGIDYVLPSFNYIKENLSRIEGIFITHGHDSQSGALGDIIKEFPNIKIYGTKFTLEIIKEEIGNDYKNLIEIEPYKKLNFETVSIFPVSLTHSVPGNVGYVINTKDGAIVYTGNFLFDQSMPFPYQTDIGKLAYIGKQGVLCLMSESLYAAKKGYTSPKNRIASIVAEIFDKSEDRILFNIFDAQLYRIQEIFSEITINKRKVVVLGRKLEGIIKKAIDMKCFDFNKADILPLSHINDKNIVVLISDEREAPYSNINKIAKGYDKFVKLTESDNVVFAAPVYDGVEKRAVKVQDLVSKIGCNVTIISTKKYLGHHASSEDLMMMINLMKPKYYFPVTGEYRHQVENAKLAEGLGMNPRNVLRRLNGEVITFLDGVLTKSESNVKVDDILVDGKTSGDIGELVLRDREMLSDNGIVIVSVTLDRQTKHILAGPEILTRGFIFVKDNMDLIDESIEIASKVIDDNTNNNYVDFSKIKSSLRDKLGRYLYKKTECRPMILVVMQEV